MDASKQEKPVVTIKIGGKVAEDPAQLEPFAADLAELSETHHLLIVHGGGAEVSRISRELGYEPRFHEGIRITLPGEMDVVEMALSGRVNKRLVRCFQAVGLPAAGLCGVDGGTFRGRTLEAEDGTETRTGNVESFQPRLLRVLFAAGFLPVLSPTSMDGQGHGVNINADSVALEIACGLQSRSLLFLSDIPGVLDGEEVLEDLSPEQVEAAIASGTISGGMIPKATSAVRALEKGVGQVIIGQYGGRGSLEKLLAGVLGTRFHR